MHVLHLTLFSTQMTIMTCNNNHFALSPPSNRQSLPNLPEKREQLADTARSRGTLCQLSLPTLPKLTNSYTLSKSAAGAKLGGAGDANEESLFRNI